MSTSSSPPSSSFFALGLGSIIGVTLGFLLLLSTLLLFSYLCCRRRRHTPPPSNPAGVVLPRIIFVAEDDIDEENQNGVVGLDPAVINSYPKFPYSKDKAGDAATCSICLCEYREGEMMRVLPDCKHWFHLGCVDAWLKLNASCPVCRSSPLPTPMSTPLQEVVPLSQYTDGRRRR